MNICITIFSFHKYQFDVYINSSQSLIKEEGLQVRLAPYLFLKKQTATTMPRIGLDLMVTTWREKGKSKKCT